MQTVDTTILSGRNQDAVDHVINQINAQFEKRFAALHERQAAAFAQLGKEKARALYDAGYSAAIRDLRAGAEQLIRAK